jgi:hypothetical protein
LLQAFHRELANNGLALQRFQGVADHGLLLEQLRDLFELAAFH